MKRTLLRARENISSGRTLAEQIFVWPSKLREKTKAKRLTDRLETTEFIKYVSNISDCSLFYVATHSPLATFSFATNDKDNLFKCNALDSTYCALC